MIAQLGRVFSRDVERASSSLSVKFPWVSPWNREGKTENSIELVASSIPGSFGTLHKDSLFVKYAVFLRKIAPSGKLDAPMDETGKFIDSPL